MSKGIPLVDNDNDNKNNNNNNRDQEKSRKLNNNNNKKKKKIAATTVATTTTAAATTTVRSRKISFSTITIVVVVIFVALSLYGNVQSIRSVRMQSSSSSRNNNNNYNNKERLAYVAPAANDKDYSDQHPQERQERQEQRWIILTNHKSNQDDRDSYYSALEEVTTNEQQQHEEKDWVAMKMIQELHAAAGAHYGWMVVDLSRQEQYEFLQEHESYCSSSSSSRSRRRGTTSTGKLLTNRFQDFLAEHQYALATELYKYCALLVAVAVQEDKENDERTPVLWIDSSNPLLLPLSQLLHQYQQHNVAVLSPPKTTKNSKKKKQYYAMHGSFLLLQPSSSSSTIPTLLRRMIAVLIHTDMHILLYKDPLLVPRILYQQVSLAVLPPYPLAAAAADDEKTTTKSTSLVPGIHDYQHHNNDNNNDDRKSWYLLEQSCWFDPLQNHHHHNHHLHLHNDDSTTDKNNNNNNDKSDSNHTLLEQGRVSTASFQCPAGSGFCCSIFSTSTPSSSSVVAPLPTTNRTRTATTRRSKHRVPILLTRQILSPIPNRMNVGALRKPFNTTLFNDSYNNYNNSTDDDDDDDDDLPYISTVSEQVKDDMPTTTKRWSLSFSLPFSSLTTSTTTTAATPNFYDILESKNCLPETEDCFKCIRETGGVTCESDCAKEHCTCFCQALCHEPVPPKVIANIFSVQPPLYQRDPTRLIPRVIHQTWSEELTPDKYPQQSRLQASFTKSGWDYHFYTDDQARQFLATHFPPHVLEAYDVLLPGAFKADLFRYCVLLIHGGVYADVDILLESNLDSVLAQDIAFAVPIDEPGGPDNRMCLWNGLIASAPGHPILAKAIEMAVNQARNRFTSIDYAASYCPNPRLSDMQHHNDLFATGPCLLGSAVNRALGRHPQTPFFEREELSVPHVFPGRIVFLKQNRRDMGAHRFSYVQENNMVVAATDLPDSKDSVPRPAGTAPHYSSTFVGMGIFGLSNVYVDRNSSNEDIVFQVVSSR